MNRFGCLGFILIFAGIALLATGLDDTGPYIYSQQERELLEDAALEFGYDEDEVYSRTRARYSGSTNPGLVFLGILMFAGATAMFIQQQRVKRRDPEDI